MIKREPGISGLSFYKRHIKIVAGSEIIQVIIREVERVIAV